MVVRRGFVSRHDHSLNLRGAVQENLVFLPCISSFFTSSTLTITGSEKRGDEGAPFFTVRVNGVVMPLHMSVFRFQSACQYRMRLMPWRLLRSASSRFPLEALHLDSFSIARGAVQVRCNVDALSEP